MEQPNLSLIKEIADNDADFEKSILDILKKEFPDEVALYKKNYNAKNYTEASDDVHKLKHKISLLGLNEDFKLAADYENELKKEDIGLHNNFVEILDKIHVYLYS